MSIWRAVPRYTVNLDLPAQDRWTHIVNLHKDDLIKATGVIDQILGNGVLGNIITKTVSGLVRSGLFYQSSEIIGIANTLEMSPGKIAMLQIFYEINTCCTSVVTRLNNVPVCFRTMDWAMEELLPLSIEVDYQKNNETIFQATTWPGYIGVLTGKNNGCTVSINYRRTNDSILNNLTRALMMSWPIGSLVRHTLETVSDYTTAQNTLANSPLIAPCYITMSGVQPDEGCVLTRNRTSEERRLKLAKQPVLVQTNIDHWSKRRSQDIEFSIARRTKAYEQVQENTEEQDFWRIFSDAPLMNFDTLYGTWMSAGLQEYHTQAMDPTVYPLWNTIG